MKGTGSIHRLMATLAAAIASGRTTTNPLKVTDDTPDLSRSTLGHIFRGSGSSPADFGVSQTCARLRRKNRMRALGISGQRI